MSVEQVAIGFVGAGKMATALARAWLAAGLTNPGLCIASDSSADARNAFRTATGIATTGENRAIAASSMIILLAVKPQDMNSVLAELKGSVTINHLVISIAAGCSIASISRGLGQDLRLVRVMPNTPALIQCCAAGYSFGPGATTADRSLVERLMNATGKAFAVQEDLLDAVTGLSGSGPAFVYAMIEALSDGGVLMGLPRTVATTLAAQTVLGAAKMILDTGLHPGVLKDQVTSPGGTTIAGLQALEKHGLRSAMMEAVAAATIRSQELGAD